MYRLRGDGGRQASGGVSVGDGGAVSGCGHTHPVMWVYTIRVGRTVVEKRLCNTCELRYLKGKRAA